MEQNLPVIAKKVRNLVRVVYSMLRKGVSKRKLLLDLNMMVKHCKIAGKKTLQNLMLNHHNNQAACSSNRQSNNSHHHSSSLLRSDSEFSCTASPATSNHSFSLFSNKHNFNNSPVEDLGMMSLSQAVLKTVGIIHSETASPALSGFERSPVVRQLRVTDSPFPMSGKDEDSHVDDAAEEFISRFYNDLRRQNTMGCLVHIEFE